MANTRPGIKFDEQGVCTGCRTYEKQQTIDWDSRWKEFWKIMDKWYNTKLFEQDRDEVWHKKFKVGTGLIK